MTESPLSRSVALLGEETVSRLAAARIAVVGVGGVGGWCAEALVRTGCRRLTVVDDDVVAPSNLNRQCPATVASVGRLKVEAMRERLLAIAPEAEIEARNERAGGEGGIAGLEGFDFVVDAIDSVDCKASLILAATSAGVPIVSSLGAALRTDPTRVRVMRFDRVEGDALARALRQRFRRLGRYPAAKFNCAVSLEPPAEAVGGVRGSVMSVTAAFGMALAAEVVGRFRVAAGNMI